MIKHRLTLCLLTALVFLCNAVLLFNPPRIAEAANGYQITGDTVFVSNNMGDVMVTPHTLTASGWVRVDFQSRSLVGDVDISFGFNGVDQVQTVKAESWENYEHTLTRQVDAVITTTFKPYKVKSVKNGSLNNPAFGTKGLNLYNADVDYEVVDTLTGQVRSESRTIAYDSYNPSTGEFTYKYNGKKIEQYKQTFLDWNKNTNTATTDYVTYKGSGKWHSQKFTQPITQNTWYTARFWVEVPFKGTKEVKGKYNVAVKPSNLTLSQSISQNKIITLDPWYNSSWLYRKSFTISHAAGVLANYQYPVKVYWAAGADGTEVVEGLTIGKVYIDGKSQADFEDIRFTTSAGDVLVDHWLESKTDSNNAIFWVEFDSIGVGATTFYIYYGNAGAASASNGVNTFIFFDDFELNNFSRWTTANDDWSTQGGVVKNGSFAAYSDAASGTGRELSKTQTLSGTFAVHYWVRATATDNTLYDIPTQGSSRYVVAYGISAVTKVQYYDGAYKDFSTALTYAANTWYLVNVYYDIPNNQYKVYFNGTLVNFVTTVLNAADVTVIPRFRNNNVAGSDGYLDDVYVRNWSSTEPAWGVWGAEETAPVYTPTVETVRITGIGSTWAILLGNVSSIPSGYLSQRGFDYGLTTSYGSSTADSGTYGTGQFGNVITGLNSGTVYHYRAKAQSAIDGSWGTGGDKMFATKGSPVIFEYHNTGDTAYWTDNSTGNSGIFGNRVAYQTFTTNSTSISHTLTSAKLLVGRVGTTPGNIIVSIRRTSGGVPTGADLVSVTESATGFNTAHAWQEFEFDEEVALLPNTKYAMVVRSPASTSNTSCVRWRWNGNGTDLFGGNAGQSQSGGVNWGSRAPADCLYELWGNYALEVMSAKVAMSYINTGDWLIVCHYNNVYPPYCPTSPFFQSSYLDVSDYFQLRLTNASGNTTLAQTKCAQWGYRPGSIYLSASSVTSLTWGSAYRVQIYGTFSPNPYMEYSLTTTDWLGSDLTRLDKYILSIAALMETHDLADYLDYIGDKGQVINDTGNALFTTGIPDLDVQRPNIFATVTDVPTPTTGTFTHGYQAALAWQALLGPDVTDTFTSVGNTFSVDGMIIGAALFFILFAMIGSVGFMSGHGIAGLVVAFPIILAAVYVGLIGLVVLGIIVAIITFFFVWRTIFAGG